MNENVMKSMLKDIRMCILVLLLKFEKFCLILNIESHIKLCIILLDVYLEAFNVKHYKI